MLAIAFLLGLKTRPAEQPDFSRERAKKRAALRRLLADIAERD